MTYEPYGVVACICPWNFPISMVTSGMLPALIAGNTVVVKPSGIYNLVSEKSSGIDARNKDSGWGG